MAQLGDYDRARKLLRRAARGFGTRERLAQARCQVAEAEVALAARDLNGPVRALDAVGRMLATTDFPIVVEGHTDNIPISTPQFPTNWELSAARAASVVRLFVDTEVDPRRLTASGYADQRPVADNATPTGRQANRRVAIRIESRTPDHRVEVPLPQ